MGETYRTDQAKEMLGRALLKFDRNRWHEERRLAAERLFEAVLEAGRAAGFEVSEKGNLALGLTEFIMTYEQPSIFVTRRHSKSEKREMAKLEYNPVKGVFEAEVDDHYTHSTPGEAHRRADGAAVVALVITRLMEG